MTMTIRPEYPRQGAAVAKLYPTAPSEVWDLDRGAAGARRAGAIRTLAPSDRTALRSSLGVSAGQGSVASKFEQPAKREHRDNLVLGLMMSAALIVGSVFGGAFAESDGPSADAAAPGPAAVDYPR